MRLFSNLPGGKKKGRKKISKRVEKEDIARNQYRHSDLQNTVNLLDRHGRDNELGYPTRRILDANKEVWITGTTLNVATSGAWRGFEKTNAKIKVILPDFTRDSIMEAAAITDNRINKNISYENGLEDQKNYTKSSFRFLNSLKTGAGKIEVKLLTYFPCYSIFAVDADYKYKDSGYISIEIIGYHYKPSIVPGFVLLKNNKNHEEFYRFFLSTWEEMWEDAFFWNEGDD